MQSGGSRTVPLRQPPLCLAADRWRKADPGLRRPGCRTSGVQMNRNDSPRTVTHWRARPQHTSTVKCKFVIPGKKGPQWPSPKRPEDL